MIPETYLADITNWPRFCFCPYNAETDEIILGLNFVQDKCPGEFVGIFHTEGQDKAEEWIKENPDYKNYFKQQP